MSRAQRYQALLAAAAMADRDLQIEAARSQRDGARTAALVGLVPALARAGISIGGQVADAQKTEAATALANRKLDIAEAAATSRENAAAARETNAAQRAADAAARADREYTLKVQKDARDVVMPEAVGATRALDAGRGWRQFVGEADENPERLIGPATKQQYEAGNADELLSKTAPTVGMSRSQLESAARESRRAEDLAATNRRDDIERKERFHSDSMASATASRANAAEERRLVREIAKGKEAKDDRKLTNSQADDVVALDEAESAMNRISSDANKVNPNIIKSGWNTVVSTLGGSTELSPYVATIRNFNSTIGVLRSGSAIGEKEQARLDQFLVAPSDTIGAVEAKRGAFLAWIKEKRSALNKARTLQGLPEVPFGSTTAPLPAGATTFEED